MEYCSQLNSLSDKLPRTARYLLWETKPRVPAKLLAAAVGLLLSYSTTAQLSGQTVPTRDSGTTAVHRTNVRLSEQLRNLNPDAVSKVIIQYRYPPTEEHYQRVRNRGGILRHHLGLIQAALYQVPVSALEDLSNDPDVIYISPDYDVHGALEYAEPTTNALTAFNDGFDGTGVGVAVIDSGISAHPDLTNAKGASRVVYSQDFVGTGTSDLFGHGQHVAGIVGGNATRSTGAAYTHTFRGIAPNSNIINLRVLDQNGSGSDSAVIQAINQAVLLKKTYNIRVINLSLGRPVYETYLLDPLCQAVEAAWRSGIVVVVAAGNSGRNNQSNTNGYGTITAPGNDPLVITVGAMKDMGTLTRTDDLIASYSSKGPTLIDHIVKPDLVAPGNHIISDLSSTGQLTTLYPANDVLTSYYQTAGTSARSADYFMLNGTSMATPMVSGAAALLIQKNPTLSPDSVKAILMKTSSKTFPKSSVATDPTTGIQYTSQYDIFTVGAGYLDVWAALNSTDTLVGNAASPYALILLGNVYIVNSEFVLLGGSGVWGSNSTWSGSAVWGPSVFAGPSTTAWGNNALWGSNAVWGNSSVGGYNAVWGHNAVWGASTNDQTESLAVAAIGEN